MEDTDTKLVVAIILGFGVLSACTFLWARGICSLWRRYLLEAITGLKHMLITSCQFPSKQKSKSLEPTAQKQSCMPAKPDIQPPPPQFSCRQSSIATWKSRTASQQAFNVHQCQSLARLAGTGEGQPPSPPKAMDFPTRHVGTSKQRQRIFDQRVLRGNPARVTTQDVPSLQGCTRSLAIPWHLLESSKKRKRRKMDHCCPSSNEMIAVPGQLVKKTQCATKTPAVANEELPRLLGRTGALTKDMIPNNCGKIPEEGIQCPADCASPQPSPLPRTSVPKSDSTKNEQRSRRKPCYRSSSCPDNITSTMSISGKQPITYTKNHTFS
eukprot:gnl/MRDRNA2_/MRDRNA2_92243_c0_seq1.p1 gnl/MRDRNA2_/MRDRNA2_92243_c0~~gnl/MRDRNA2_/MRDRNA2_92243_c0_seq1.p1  ORF type:complete len:372 (-),score=43.44 gnl/MRDRNA2_/MRDRNA2_92243_c0_seq1:172-1146(-)